MSDPRRAEILADLRNNKTAKTEGTLRVIHMRSLWRKASRKYYQLHKTEFNAKRKAQAAAKKLDKALKEASK